MPQTYEGHRKHRECPGEEDASIDDVVGTIKERFDLLHNRPSKKSLPMILRERIVVRKGIVAITRCESAIYEVEKLLVHRVDHNIYRTVLATSQPSSSAPPNTSSSAY